MEKQHRNKRLSRTEADARLYGRRPVAPAPPRPAQPAAEEVAPEIRRIKPARRSRKKLIIGGVVAVLIIGTATGLYLARPKSPIPKNISHAVSFPIYYPSQLPEGYHLKQESFSVQNGIVFYSIVNGDRTVAVSEQTSPSSSFDFSNTPGFGEIPATAGDAHAGMVNGSPVAIIVAQKTMINLRGSKNVSSGLIAQLAAALTAPSQ